VPNAPAGSLNTRAIILEQVTVNSCIHAQLDIWASIVVKFHQIPTSIVGEVAYTRISDWQISFTILWWAQKKYVFTKPTIEVVNQVHHQISGLSTALLEVCRPRVPVAKLLGPRPKPTLYHWQQQVLYTEHNKLWTWSIGVGVLPMKQDWVSIMFWYILVNILQIRSIWVQVSTSEFTVYKKLYVR